MKFFIASFGLLFGLLFFSFLHCSMSWKEISDMPSSSPEGRSYSRRSRRYRELNGLAPKPKAPVSDPIAIPGPSTRYITLVQDGDESPKGPIGSVSPNWPPHWKNARKFFFGKK